MISLLILGLGLALQSPSPAQDVDLSELMRLEAVWNEAHLRGDASALDRLWADSRRFARLFGIPDRTWPRDWAAFRAYFDGVLASNVLAVGAASRRLAKFLLTPPNAAVVPAWKWYAAITAGLVVTDGAQWGAALLTAAVAALVSVLMSIGGTTAGDPQSPSYWGQP